MDDLLMKMLQDRSWLLEHYDHWRLRTEDGDAVPPSSALARFDRPFVSPLIFSSIASVWLGTINSSEIHSNLTFSGHLWSTIIRWKKYSYNPLQCITKTIRPSKFSQSLQDWRFSYRNPATAAWNDHLIRWSSWSDLDRHTHECTEHSICLISLFNCF